MTAVGRFEKFVLAKRMAAIGKAAVQKLSINCWSRPTAVIDRTFAYASSTK
jgi:hypothetical protein